MADEKVNINAKEPTTKEESIKEKMIDKVIERLHAEIYDSEMYLDAAISMDKNGEVDEKIVHGLYEMAKEEYTHAYFFRDYLIDHGISIPEECEKNYHELEFKMEDAFR